MMKKEEQLRNVIDQHMYALTLALAEGDKELAEKIRDEFTGRMEDGIVNNFGDINAQLAIATLIAKGEFDPDADEV